MGIPPHLKQTVTTVCTDMDQGDVNAARVALPHAQVVVDRFHVAQAYRNGADAVCQRELRGCFKRHRLFDSALNDPPSNPP